VTIFLRRQQLINLLNENPGIGVGELSRQLHVSEGTIRNDLRDLAASGSLMRVRGGAVPVENQVGRSPAFAERITANSSTKACIAGRAVEVIQDGDSLFLDASSTVFHLSQFMTGFRGLTIVTNGLEVAIALAKNVYNTVILFGGVLRPDGTSITIPVSDYTIENLHIKKALVSCSGFSLESGLTEVDLQEANLKRKILDAIPSVTALVDSSKFGKVDLTSFISAKRITTLYTDCGISEEWTDRMLQAGINLIVCGENSDPSMEN
jgi:DeoR/GlpR family transcriptional regulator of sugar metabolism